MMSISVPNVLDLLRWLACQIRQCGSAGRMGLSVATGVAGIGLTLASLWGLVQVIGVLGSGDALEMNLLGIGVSLPAQAETLIALAGVGMAAGGALTYCSEIIGLKVIRRLMDHVRDEMARACRGAGSDLALHDSQTSSVTSLLQITTRECGMAGVQFVRLPVALCTGGICFAILAVVSPTTLLVLLAITPIYCFVLNRLNRHSHRMHEEHGKLAAPARRELTTAYGSLDRGHAPDFDPTSSESMPDLSRSDDIMLGRISLVRAVTLLNTLTTVVVIIALIAMMGSGSLGLGDDWATLLVIIIVVRFLAGSIQRISVAINVVSRFTGSIKLADGIQSNDRKAVLPTELPRGLVILANRIDRIQVVRGLLELSTAHPILKQRTIAIDLDQPGCSEDMERAVVRDATAVQSETHPLDELPIVLASRTVQAIENAGQRGFMPTLAADLRTEPPTVQRWDRIVEDAIGSETVPEDQGPLDDEGLIDDF